MSGKRNCIAVCRLSSLGDVAIAVPVLKQFRAQYPSVELVVVTKPFFQALFKHLAGVKVVSVETGGKHSGFLGLLKLAKELKALNISGLADIHDVLRTKLLRNYLSFLGIPSAKINKGRRAKAALVRSTNKQLKQLPSTASRYQAVFAKLGYPFELKDRQVRERLKMSDRLEAVMENLNARKYIGIAPFATHVSKQYQPEWMLQVINKLLREDDSLQILLFGGGQEEESKLEAMAAKDTRIFSLVGKYTFEEELQVISNLDLMISMDSGNGHLAAMFGVDVITLWLGTHPYAGFAPFAQPEEHQLLPDLEKFPFLPNSIYGNKTIPQYQEVVNSLAPEKLIDLVQKILN